MKAKIYYILHGDVFGNYSITAAHPITVNNITDLISQAKKHHSLPGKQYTIVTEENKVFHVTKVGRVWKAYELLAPKENENASDH